jgi:hypothetical protein
VTNADEEDLELRDGARSGTGGQSVTIRSTDPTRDLLADSQNIRSRSNLRNAGNAIEWTEDDDAYASQLHSRESTFSDGPRIEPFQTEPERMNTPDHSSGEDESSNTTTSSQISFGGADLTSFVLR